MCKCVHLSHLFLLCPAYHCKAYSLSGSYALVQPGRICMIDLSTEAKLLTVRIWIYKQLSCNKMKKKNLQL